MSLICTHFEQVEHWLAGPARWPWVTITGCLRHAWGLLVWFKCPRGPSKEGCTSGEFTGILVHGVDEWPWAFLDYSLV